MARIAENTVIIDGQEYKPGDAVPDFKSIKCVDVREPRKYQGLSADVSVLNDVIAKYASGGASCFMSDTGEYYEYDREEKTWKLITNITERGFDSEKAYGALKHMLNLKNEVIDTSVKAWLADHPEATTTVQDGSIEEIKINKNFLPWIKKDYVTLEMFGAIGDGVNDDSNALKLAISSNKPILLLNKTYLISKGVSTKQLNIKGRGFNSILKYTGNDYLFTLAENSVRYGSSFSDLKIDCSDTGSGININNKQCWGTKITNCVIINSVIGIRSICIETLIEGCSLYNYNIIYNSTGIILNTTDSRINNTEIINFQTGVSSNGGSNLINAHIWVSLLFQECTGVDLTNSSGGAFFSNFLVLDSVKTGIALNQYSRCSFDKIHCVMNTYVPFTEMVVFKNITKTFYGTLFVRTLSLFGDENITFNIEPNKTYSLVNINSWYDKIGIYNIYNAYKATVINEIPSPTKLLVDLRGYSGNGYTIPNGTDLNTFNQVGIYFFNGNNVTHSPTTEKTNYLINYNGETVGPQIVISNNNEIYFRTYPTRQDWRKITAENSPPVN